MVVSQNSPKRRRQSIAVPNASAAANPSKSRRRAHSIAPGDLSPFAKRRRSLVPRKSILKTFTNITNNGDDLPDSSQPQSSQPQSSQVSLDEDSGTQSMEMTQDYQRDYSSRKSLGGNRRVSFAADVHVRLIDGKKKDSSSQPSPEEPPRHSQGPTDENAYPGASSSRRRRSSVRYSMASEDMDMTTVIPSNFVTGDDSALMEEEFDPLDDDDGMEMTEVLNADIFRRRSVSLGANRTPLAQISQSPDRSMAEHDASHSFEDETSHTVSSVASDRSSVMEFTMPLNSTLRPPAHQDEAWMALRQATHSGDTPIEPEYSSDDEEFGQPPVVDGNGMELDDAVERLKRARDSLPGNQVSQAPYLETVEEDSLISEEMSFDDGNETMNVSRVYGFANSTPRPSMGMGYESTMDESEIYGAIVAAQPPRFSIAPEQAISEEPQSPEKSQSPPPVFSRPEPQPQTSVQPQSDIPPAFAFQKAPEPSRTPSPPQANPSQSRASTPSKTGPSATYRASASPLKRPRTPEDDGSQLEEADRPSPAKRPTVWERLSAPSPRALRSPKPPPKPLSPAKKAPFQQPEPGSSVQRPSALRRPSGYFARRKSLGVGLGQTSTPASPAKVSPQKPAPAAARRASVAPSFGSGRVAFTFVSPTKGKEKEHGCEREVIRQAVASPTVTRGSPAPASPRPASPAPAARLSSQPVPAVDVSMPDASETSTQRDTAAATEQWRNAVEPMAMDEEDEPPISIHQFFSMTGIKFMDELGAPRRSMYPQSMPTRQARPSEEIPLSEYTVAMGLDLPQLVLYGRVSKDLQAWIEKSKADLQQAEDEAEKITPQLFIEYSRADEEGQAELLHQLQLIRTNTRAQAKSDWYEWKLQWLEGLHTTAEETFKSLEEDAILIDEIRTEAEEIIPSLEEEYATLLKELEQERAEVAEIEAGDQEYLNELKASIAEQNIEVEALRAELAESKLQLRHLEERKAETESQKQEAISAIENGQKLLHVQKNSTRVEVFRLKDELEALEDLHMVRITKVEPDVFEYIYASRFTVTLPCQNYQPLLQKMDITRVDRTRSKHKDRFSRLSDLFLRMAKEQIVRSDFTTTRQVVQRLSDYWSSCAQIRSQLKLLSVKYPVDIEIIQDSQEGLPSFKAKAMVLFPTLKAKAVVSFIFNAETFCYWPFSIGGLTCDAEVVYGNVDRQSILNALSSRLEEATPAENYACLLDSCIECQEIYH